MYIPPAAAPPFQKDKGALILPKIVNQLSGPGLLQYGSRRNGDADRLAIPAITLRPLAIPAVLGLKRLFIPKMGQGPEVMADFKDHIPPSAPIAPRRASQGNVLFPAKGGTAVPAGTRRDLYKRFIGKFYHDLCRVYGYRGNTKQRAYPEQPVTHSRFLAGAAFGILFYKKSRLPGIISIELKFDALKFDKLRLDKLRFDGTPQLPHSEPTSRNHSTPREFIPNRRRLHPPISGPAGQRR
jgi:hypothetical protein